MSRAHVGVANNVELNPEIVNLIKTRLYMGGSSIDGLNSRKVGI